MTKLNELIEKDINCIESFCDLVDSSNSLGCADGKIIGTGRSDYTQDSTVYDLSVNGKTFSLIDIPGIEGDESRFEETIKTSLDKAHTIFYVNGSGKKIEKETLKKIKSYMHDGTSVYAVFNVHCKPKMERIQSIDKPYSEELREAYKQQAEIAGQTEAELKSFLGDNYKGRILVNGLLSFCGLAFDSNDATSIVNDTEKNLRSDQKKYLKEYNGSRKEMIKDSGISRIQDIIVDKTSGFDKYIYDENIKKLKNRLFEMIARINTLNIKESQKINNFIGLYDEFDEKCRNAKDVYIHSMSQIGYHAASDAFTDIKNKLFDMIEESEGKLSSGKVQRYFDDNKNRIINNLEKSLNYRIEKAQNVYEESVEDAIQRLVKDFDREKTKFNISLSNVSVSIDESFMKELNYNFKNFGKDVLNIVGYAAGGCAVGGAFLPGIGNIVGAAVGAVVGVFQRIWNFFATKHKRINRAKERLQEVIDEQIDYVDGKISSCLRDMEYEEKITKSYNQIHGRIETQKRLLNNIKEIMNKILSKLKTKYNKLS